MTEKRFIPLINLTETFVLNNNVQVQKFSSNDIKTTYNKTFNKFDIDFTRKANFNDKSER